MKLQISCEEAVVPPCPHFGFCGGCKYQHVAYDEQLAQKQTYIATLFNREVSDIVASEPFWRYRNKMEFSFSQARSGEKFLGLMRGRGRVENLESCWLTSFWFMEALSFVRQWWESTNIRAYYPPKDEGTLRTLTLREGVYTGEKMAILTISGRNEYALSQKEVEEFKETLQGVDTVVLRKQIIAKKCPTRFEQTLLKGEGRIRENLHGQDGRVWTFSIRSDSFFQPNTRSAETLYQLALESAKLDPNDCVLDLYCGTGTLGIFASSLVKEVIGIELNSDAVADAKYNFELNGVQNMRVIEGDVGEVLGELDFSANVVIVDPPRVGLGKEALKHLMELYPSKIIYISCNPVTQTAECNTLCERGYDIVSIQPVDQFPHTPHIENIVLLTRVIRAIG